jgi:hypothetical protein
VLKESEGQDSDESSTSSGKWDGLFCKN